MALVAFHQVSSRLTWTTYTVWQVGNVSSAGSDFMQKVNVPELQPPDRDMLGMESAKQLICNPYLVVVYEEGS